MTHFGQSLLNTWNRMSSKRSQDEGNKDKEESSASVANTLPTRTLTPEPTVLITRKQKRRLAKTVSASDLIREEEAAKNNADKTNDAPAFWPFFVSRQTPAPPPRPVVQNKYLNETAFVQQLEQSRRWMEATRTELPRQQSYPDRLSRAAVRPHTDTTTQKGGFRLPFDVFMADESAKMVCQRCIALETELEAVQEDLEYLRGLRGGSICSCCQEAKLENGALHEASQRLNQVTGRHKAQIEQITFHRSRWQQDMHFKLQKFANLCKDLNEESAARNEAAKALERQLEEARTERDDMAAEIRYLRAQVALHQQNERQNQHLMQQVEEYETRGIQRAVEAVQQRDKIIEDISMRLETALETLELEREQQRQRRQIIFPVSRPNNADDVTEELRELREMYRESQAELESAKSRANQLEMRLAQLSSQGDE